MDGDATRGQCIFNPVFQKQVLAALPHKRALNGPLVSRGIHVKDYLNPPPLSFYFAY